MDTLNKIVMLAERAKKHESPTFSVADRVMKQIQSKQTAVANFFIFDIFAAAAAVAASVVLFFGIQCWSYITSPLTKLFAPLSGGSLW